MSSSARTWFVVGLIIVIGAIVTLGTVNRSSPVDPDEFRELVVRSDAGEVPGTLVSSEPCRTAAGSEECVEITHPVTRPLGGGTPVGRSVTVTPGQRLEIDASGRAAGLTAYVGRYLRPADAPIADGDDAAADFERITTGRVEEVAKRWYVELPAVVDEGDLLLLRFDHARAVKSPFPTVEGPAGDDELSIAWFEIPLETSSTP